MPATRTEERPTRQPPGWPVTWSLLGIPLNRMRRHALQRPLNKTYDRPAAQHPQQIGPGDEDGKRGRGVPLKEVYRRLLAVLEREHADDGDEDQQQQEIDEPHDRTSLKNQP